ncbi:MAG: helix-turn-helix domain-containing protein [Thermodesulfobacteriota bacterium]
MEAYSYTTEELSKLLRISPITIHRHIKGGLIPCVKHGGRNIFPKDVIDSWLWYRATKDLKPEIKLGMEAMKPIKDTLKKLADEMASGKKPVLKYNVERGEWIYDYE